MGQYFSSLIQYFSSLIQPTVDPPQDAAPPIQPSVDPPHEMPPAFPTAIFQASSIEFREAIVTLIREKEAAQAHDKDLQKKLSHVNRTLLSPFARARNVDRITPNLMKELLRNALEGESLGRQGRMLQNEVRRLRSVIKPNDEQVRTNGRMTTLFRTLSTHIHNLATAVAANPDANPFIEPILSATLIRPVEEAFRPVNHDLSSTLLEAFTWSILLSLVFASPFSPFLSYQDDRFRMIWTDMFGSQHDAGCATGINLCQVYGHTWPVPSQASERWKASTYEALNMGTRGPERTVARKREVRTRILGSLDTVVPGTSALPETMEVLNMIINEAFELAEQIGMQWERVQLWVPQLGDQYPGEGSRNWATRMRNVLEGGPPEGNVFAIISPGLIRWGYEMNRTSDEGTVLIPSGVILDGVIGH